MYYPNRKTFQRATVTLTALALTVTPTWAVTGTGLPWEQPMAKLKNSMTGPVAIGVGSIGIMGVAVGAALMREHLQEVMAKFSNLGLTLGLGLFAVAALGTWFGVVAATV